MDDWTDRRVVIMGLGRFGGGEGAARFCATRGADVLVTDQLGENDLHGPLQTLADLPLRFRLGAHDESDFSAADLIVVNPAVDQRDNRFLHAAREARAEITTEIRLLVERLPNRGRTIGVTGTAGKSTTTAMIGHLLARTLENRVHVGGNLGGSLLESLDLIGPDDWVVLELSSFMLETIGDWSPHVAVVTNISENHLDRHGTMSEYVAAKQRVLQHQAAGDFAILGTSVANWPRKVGVDAMIIDDNGDTDVELSIPGRHNRINALMALAVADAIDGGAKNRSGALRDFAGLPHRLQLVGAQDGMRFYDDSKSTTPTATVLAIEAFENASTVHLIAGGYDKGVDLTPIAEIAPRLARLYTIGTTGDSLAKSSADRGASCTDCETLDRAVSTALAHMKSGDVLLLSPGCASWDQFTNFQQRGQAFVQCIERELARPRATAQP